MDDTLKKTIDDCVTKFGPAALEQSLRSMLEEHQDHILTIVVNAGQHPLRSVHSRGEVFFASEGFFDYATKDAIEEQFEEVLRRVADKLRSKPWKSVYLVPFGPSVLSMQIKLLVYRVLHLETIDVLHVGDDEYFDIKLDQRRAVAELEDLARAYNPWTPDEEADLSNEFDRGISIKELSELHQRTLGAIRSRLVRIGKLDSD